MDETNPLNTCSRCQSLPSQIQVSGCLYLWLALDHSLSKITHCLKAAQFNYQLKKDRCLIIKLGVESIEGCLDALTDALTQFERNSTKALFVPHCREPQLQDFPRLTTLSSFISLRRSGWLIDMLAAERVTSQFQPIVYGEDPACVFGQEALFRGLADDGSLIPPAKIFSLAAEADILVQLDLFARYSAIRQAKHHQIQEKVFINFTPASIYDPAFCLRSTMKAIDQAGISHRQIVFEVVESDRVEDIAHLKKILNAYREAGFSVALDDFGVGYSNLNLLHQLRPDFIKLDKSLIRNVHLDDYQALVTEKILEIAARLNIQTVAEGVETQQELDWVRERGATFVQGYLIAKPSTVPITNLSQATLDN